MTKGKRNTLGSIMARVDVRPDGCWLWTGNAYPNGYGIVSWGGKYRNLHRLIYELLVGPIPAGLHIDHLCRTPRCVNPSHLEPVTKRENERRGMAGILKTHCIHGHEYTPENTRWNGPRRAWRSCLTCERQRNRS